MQKNDDCIAVYSRKSKFTGKGESIGNQVELCREYVRAHYGDRAGEHMIIYEDEGFSGGNLNRPDFKKMMKAAREGRFRVIIVYRLDRISRNISDFSSLIEELTKLDIAFVSIKEQFDTGTPMGRAMMYIASVFSQLERETIAERIRDNMHELAKTGRWLGGTTPTGYASEGVVRVNVDGKKKKACRLKLIPGEAENVRMIYDLFLENGSLTVTEAELMRRGIVSKNGKYYTRFSIKAILQNPVYMIADQDAYDYFINKETELFSDRREFDGIKGILAYNRTDQEKGRATIYLPAKEWIVSVGEHPGIIGGRAWVRVQKMLEQNKSGAFRRSRGNEALLTGLLYCSCGSRMYPKLDKRRSTDGRPACTYVCKMKERSRRSLCNGKNVNGNQLDAAVMEQLRMLDEDYECFLGRLKQNRGCCKESRSRYEECLASLQRDKEDTERKIEALIDSLIGLGDCGIQESVTKRIRCLSRECKAMESRIGELESLRAKAASENSVMNAGGLLRMADFGMEGMTVEQKRAAIRALVRKVIWDGENVHVVLNGAPDEAVEALDILAAYKSDDARRSS